MFVLAIGLARAAPRHDVVARDVVGRRDGSWRRLRDGAVLHRVARGLRSAGDLGRIQGTAQALTVVASALGPLLVAWGVERTGSHAFVFLVLAVLIASLGLASLVVRLPRPSDS